jgi:sRNA-binding protein
MAKESIEERELRLLQGSIKGSINATEVQFHKERYEKKKRIREIERKEKAKKKRKKKKV